jgi:poly(3-hydroxybutyrate) depolymerase
MPRRGPARSCALALASLLLGACGSGRSTPAPDERLPSLEIVPGSVTVSGISAGGYMAVQFHVAYSGLVNGVGVIAAGPYYCAESSARLALGRCMHGGAGIPVGELASLTSQLALEQQIDPISDLVNDQVWILHGARDEVVAKTVVDALETYYATLVEPRGIVRVEHPAAAHTFPTSTTGGKCAESGSPYVGDCDYDAAGKLLEHLYPGLESRGRADAGRLQTFDQRPYAELAATSALAASGWLYVPEPCRDGRTACRLHVVFHGCRQGASFVGDRFVKEAGYLEWASSNRIVVLFPQIEAGMQPLNPNGCWDWWGYEDARYALRDGPQMLAVRAMIADVRGEMPR